MIYGNISVERYIPGRRRYRIITSPVTTAESMYETWQNNGDNTVRARGTFITGGKAQDGFDQQTTKASVFTYDSDRRRYVGYTTANGKNTKFTRLFAGVPYYMFVFGDRVNHYASPTPYYTVLSARGKLLIGDQQF